MLPRILALRFAVGVGALPVGREVLLVDFLPTALFSYEGAGFVFGAWDEGFARGVPFTVDEWGGGGGGGDAEPESIA